MDQLILKTESIGDEGLILKKQGANILGLFYPGETDPRAILWWDYQGEIVYLRPYGEKERPEKICLVGDTAKIFLREKTKQENCI